MTENYTPPAVWQRWADEGGTMAILTVQESADMLKRMAERVIDDNRSQPLYPSYARAILNVVSVLDGVTAERDALKAKWDALELRVEQLAALPAEFASVKADNLTLTQRNAALMSVLWSIEDWLEWHTDDMRASGLLAQVRDALRNNK